MKRIILTLSVVWIACASSVNAHGPVKGHAPNVLYKHTQNVNRIARWLGLGFSDGYHAKNGYAAPMYPGPMPYHQPAYQQEQSYPAPYQSPTKTKPSTPATSPEEVPAPKSKVDLSRTMQNRVPNVARPVRPSQQFQPHPTPRPQPMQLRPATGRRPTWNYGR